MPEERKRGRPKAHRLSASTRQKISDSLKAHRRGERRIAATLDAVPDGTREAVVARDEGRCRGCHEKDDLAVYTFQEDAPLDDLDNHALLCGWCRNEASALGKVSARQVP